MPREIELDIPATAEDREARRITTGWDRWYAGLPDDLKRKLSVHDFKRLGDCFRDAFHIPETVWPSQPMERICECLSCGRSHRRLGTPPWALGHDEACRLSVVFNEGANLHRTQDVAINDWLKRVIVAARSTDDLR